MPKAYKSSVEQINFLDDGYGAIPDGNTEMIDYGIQNDGSDYRIHVCSEVGRVYGFPTSAGIKAIEAANNLKLRVVRLGMATAKGYAVPVSLIASICEVVVPKKLLDKYPIHASDSTSLKGLKAASIVYGMLTGGLIPLPYQAQEVEDMDLQLRGSDIIIDAKFHIQVKCDMRGGDAKYGGTGNLFLQTAECNPYKLY